MEQDTVLSVLVLAIIALVIGAIALLRRGGRTKQAVLMLVLAAVAAGNLALWLVPDSAGRSLAQDAPR